MNSKPTEVFWHTAKIQAEDRHRLNGHKSCVIWLTGLSASGKSTLANELDKVLFERSIRSYVLDGDNIRHGLNKDLGFSPDDRKENIRRIGEVAKLLVDAGLFTITAFISPYREDRDSVRALLPEGQFIEVYVKCTVAECERRDPKGLYKKARNNEIREFTGISAPYEEPLHAELIIDTENDTIAECVEQLVAYLEQHSYM
ncbi:adenylylsulfate kinase [Gordoniibacillus kamchatkensis]|uniref:Adenylyl-sulfate kinase n=1 Tax=Gordoniibacillus kamchatkensis TaxID=1590651 RepID=A0ABR5ACD8_9BACL|nr:adenylyl-sulfate kinase [Paenibacillus sp. VKM B-2647]KIL38715.1 adenylylsulfate kinase [Paenibacillus sp. VKM B-2647]